MKMPDPQPRTSKWLRRTQENSWEPEILISGIVLLALTQVPRLLDSALYFLEERTFALNTNVATKLFMLLKTATYWLIFMLIVHLIFRSVWLSFVGLSYAFPNGIDIRKLRLQSYFEKRLMRLPDFESSVIKLERICSTIYAIAFLLVMATISAFIYLTIFIFLVIIISQVAPGILGDDQSIDTVFTWIVIFTGLPYVIDFLTLGLLKRIRWFWWVYRPVYLLMSFITFSTVYRGIYYGLVTNLRKRTMILGLLIFIGITALITMRADGSLIDRTKMINGNSFLSSFEGYYRDADPHRMSKWAHIQSDVIDDEVLKLFVVHKRSVEEHIIKTCPDYDNMMKHKENRDAVQPEYWARILRTDSIHMHCITNYYNVSIDGNMVNIERWYMREMNEAGQQGIITWIDISGLSRGHHTLEIFAGKEANRIQVAHIPFFNIGNILNTVQDTLNQKAIKSLSEE